MLPITMNAEKQRYLPLSFSPGFFLYLLYTRRHIHTQIRTPYSLSLLHSQILYHILPITVSWSHTHTHTHTVSLSLSLALCHKLIHFHPPPCVAGCAGGLAGVMSVCVCVCVGVCEIVCARAHLGARARA